MYNKLLLFILLVVSTCSCVPVNSSNDKMTGVPIALNDMNKEIVIREGLDMVDIYRSFGTLDFKVENLSSSPISFPADFNVRIFINTGGKWQSVENQVDYSGSGTILPIRSEYPPGIIVSVMPVLSIEQSRNALRVIMWGKTVDTGEIVGAYLDVNLK